VKPRIGGWLVLPGIGLATGCVLGVVSVAQSLVLTADAFDAGYGRTFVRALALDVGLVAFTIVATIRFLSRKRNAPWIVMALLATWVVVEAVLVITTQHQGQPSGGGAWIALVRTAVMSSIWIAYFAVSKRVKATFVN
jgi:hypothetical protein